MVKDCARSFLLVILLAALPLTGLAQDAKTVLSKAAKPMGVENLRTMHYSGSGASYDVMIEGVYREYMDFGGLKVPTIVIQNRGGQLSQVVIVKDAKPNG